MEKPIFDRSFAYHDILTADVDGFTLDARLEADDSSDAPWERSDCHGPVSDWTRRAKSAGERVLCSDRGNHRYYDVAEAMRIAKRDGWDAPPYGEGTKGQRAARAVEADFQRLRAWCNDHWSYVGVVLSISRNGVMLDKHAASLWGIESDCHEYLTGVANELADEALAAGRAALALLCDCDEDEEPEEEEPAPVMLPDWLVTDIERRAQAERDAGGSIEINRGLPYVAVKLSDGSEYFFQEHEASTLLDTVPDNVSDEDFILWQAQGW